MKTNYISSSPFCEIFAANRSSLFYPLSFEYSNGLKQQVFILLSVLSFVLSSNLFGQTVIAISEDFSVSTTDFTEVAGGTWTVSGGRYVLSSPASASVGNGNISVHDTSISGDFTLAVDALTTGTASGWNDFSIIFGYQDSSNYYFVSFNESNDGNTQGLFRVVSGTIVELDDFGAGTTITEDVLYEVTIERSGSSITVDLDGTEVGSVSDSTYTSGLVGFGSRNDGAEFDDLVVIIPDTVAPTTPTGLAASNVTSSSVDLSWNTASDNVAVTGYKIYTGGANPVSVTGTNTTLSVSESTSYTFTVSAVDGAGNESAQSNGIGVTTPSSVAGISEDFSVSATDFTEIAGGTWTVSGGRYVLSNPANVSEGNGNISVHDTSISGDFTLTVDALTTGTTSGWNDFSIIFGYQDSSNYYFVSFNESNDGNTQGLFRVVSGTIVELDDFGSVATITEDVLYEVVITRSGSNIVVELDGVEVGSVSDSTYTSGLVGFGSRNDGAEFDNLEVEEIVADTTAPSVPTGLTFSNVSSTSVDLDWNASTDNVGVTGYYVYTDGANPVSVSGVSVTVAGLNPNTSYDFTVSAYDAAANESSESSGESVTTNPSSSSGFPTHPDQVGLSGLSIDRLTLTSSSQMTFTSADAGKTITDVRFNGQVKLQSGANNITFKRCWFQGHTWYTVLGQGGQNPTFEDCDFGSYGSSKHVGGSHMLNLAGTVTISRCFFYNSSDPITVSNGSVVYIDNSWLQPVYVSGTHLDSMQIHDNNVGEVYAYRCTFEKRTWTFGGTIAQSQEELTASSITTSNIAHWGNATLQTKPCGTTGGCSGPVSGCYYSFEECLTTGGNYIMTAENQNGDFINNTILRGSANPSTDSGIRHGGNLTISGNIFHDDSATYTGGSVGNGNPDPISNYSW